MSSGDALQQAVLASMGLLALGVAACHEQRDPERDTRAVQQPLSDGAATRFAELALDCVHRPYPNKVAHVLHGPQDVAPPRELTPAFYGCYDWHSSVHGHWMLVRLSRHMPSAPFVPPVVEVLDRSLTPENIAAERRYLAARPGFERPYGLAWLLQLGVELRQWDHPRASTWAETLAPLEEAAIAHVETWLPKLTHPIRSGEHSQTAFAMGLLLDWAKATGDVDLARLVEQRARTFHGADRACPLGYEPSGHDFLSPCLAEADLMRRVLEPKAFGQWLARALPQIPGDGTAAWLRPAKAADRRDGKLVHLDGLNLSRAWMLEGIRAGLPPGDPRVAALQAAARTHRSAGLAAVDDEHYTGSHWLGSFAVYLTTGRGLPR